MRKGFTLVEILILVIVLPFVFLLFDGLFKTIAGEIPMSVRIVQENTSLLNVLRQVQKDVDQAKDLPKSFAGETASNHVLLIELAEGVICYKLRMARLFGNNLPIHLKVKLRSRDPGRYHMRTLNGMFGKEMVRAMLSRPTPISNMEEGASG